MPQFYTDISKHYGEFVAWGLEKMRTCSVVSGCVDIELHSQYCGHF